MINISQYEMRIMSSFIVDMVKKILKVIYLTVFLLVAWNAKKPDRKYNNYRYFLEINHIYWLLLK